MKQTAAQLAVYALEQLGITHTFGIPGVHNTELYDALSHSNSITPVLVAHEQGGAFLAEGMSRASQSANIGTLVIVPAAGLTHSASGIGEAYLGGIPMLVITGGIRNDTPYTYKLHEVDQLEVAKGFTKAAFRITDNNDVVSTLFKAYEIATEGCPGPVLVEIPVDLQLFPGNLDGPLPIWTKRQHWSDTQACQSIANASNIDACVNELLSARQAAMFVGWGARAVKNELRDIAELLNAPVATTLQGLSSFPHEHPLHAGFGFSPSAVPSAQNAYAKADCLLAIGARFAEIPTGSYGLTVPEKLVHLDIDEQVISANYPATASLTGDARVTVPALLKALREKIKSKPLDNALVKQIAQDKAAYQKAWLAHNRKDKVNAARFFHALRDAMPDNAITVLDDGNHTFMTAELFPIKREGLLLTPTDFNAMGYAVPATIGAKLANPDREVFSIVGDGCFTMTCMEILTAKQQGIGVIYFVFSDGELSQIAQAQQIPYQEKACTILPGVNISGIATATGASYFNINTDRDIDSVITEARKTAANNIPVIVDINIDYSKKTAFTKGTSVTTFKGFALKDKLRFAGRIVKRKVPFMN